MAEQTHNVTAPDGRHWFVIAPEGVTRDQVIEFAKVRADSWENGRTYRMVRKADQTAALLRAKENEKVDTAVGQLDEQLDEIGRRRRGLMEGRLHPGRAALLGGATKPKEFIQQEGKELDALKREKQTQRDRLAIGSEGEIVGGVGGALAGAGTGAGIGGLVAGPVGAAVGGFLGALGGAFGGTYAGSRLWDLDESRQAKKLTDEEAHKLALDRAVEGLIWDGAFVLVLGPAGKVIGKISRGSPAAAALRDSAKEIVSWEAVKQAPRQLTKDVIVSRAAHAGAEQEAGQVSRALGQQPRVSTGDVLVDLAGRTGGELPSRGAMEGVVRSGEQFARSQGPERFFDNARALVKASDGIRDEALMVLDQAGAKTGVDAGEALTMVLQKADESLKLRTGKVFQEARNANFAVDLGDVLKYLRSVQKRDAAAAGQFLTAAERGEVDRIVKALEEDSILPADAAMDFLSGIKRSQRALKMEGQPAEQFDAIVAEMTTMTQKEFDANLKLVEPKLQKKLKAARQLYGMTMEDLYNDTMSRVARKGIVVRPAPGPGGVVQVRELRAALKRAENVAMRRKGKGFNRETAIRERRQIDAGMVKDYLEKHTQSLDALDVRMKDPDFRMTLKELLTGRDAADPQLGREMLDELDRVVSAVRIIRPEMAPRPGAAGVIPGMGSVGAGTVFGAATGGSIQSAVISALAFIFGIRKIGQAVATAMTTADRGMLRNIQLAARMAPVAGKRVAAAEAILDIAKKMGWEPEMMAQDGGAMDQEN